MKFLWNVKKINVKKLFWLQNFHAQNHEKHDFLGPGNHFLRTLTICVQLWVFKVLRNVEGKWSAIKMWNFGGRSLKINFSKEKNQKFKPQNFHAQNHGEHDFLKKSKFWRFKRCIGWMKCDKDLKFCWKIKNNTIYQ